jgi:hypothetical protein
MAPSPSIKLAQNKLRNTINMYNKNLSPLGLRFVKFRDPNLFQIVHGKASHILVSTNPGNMSATFQRGNTYSKNRGKGIGLVLRTFATALLRNAGYVKVAHQGFNFQNRNNASMKKTGNLPITTYMLRKNLGFKPTGNAQNNRSVWLANSRSGVAKLRNAEQRSRNKLRSLPRSP